MTAVVVIEGVVIALLVVLVTGLLRSHAEILRQLHVLNGGTPHLAHVEVSRPAASSAASDVAYDLVGETPSGEVAALSVVGAPDAFLLAFLSSNCLSCAGFWDRFRQRQSIDLPDATRLVVITKGSDEESLSRVNDLAAPDLTVIMSSQAWSDYGVPGSPYFVLADGPSGQVAGEGTAGQWDQVLALVSQAAADARALQARTGDGRGADDASRIDAELRAAGIQPGHPSLYGGITSKREAG